MKQVTKELIVVKYGSSSIAGPTGLDMDKLGHHAEQLAIAAERFSLVVTSSGSVAVGRALEAARGRDPADVSDQILAMRGSAQASAGWNTELGKWGLAGGQLLVTHREIGNPEERSSMIHTITGAVEAGIIPIVNENDALSEGERNRELSRLAFNGDNDGLAARVAIALKADRLILLSDVDGVRDDSGTVVSRVPYETASHDQVRGYAYASNGMGRGGMATKIDAVITAAEMGVPAHIAPSDGDLMEVVDGASGTYFMPNPEAAV